MADGLQFEDDKLAITAKAGMADEILNIYKVFGWEVKGRYDDGQYGDIVHINFSRPHRIEGKDRLQLLQVRFEVALNFLGRAHRMIFLRAVIFGVLIALVGLALAVYGAFVMAYSTTNLFFAGGIVLICAGVLFFVIAGLTANKLYVQDGQKYGVLATVLKENITSIVNEASLITGITAGRDGGKGAEDAH